MCPAGSETRLMISAINSCRKASGPVTDERRDEAVEEGERTRKGDDTPTCRGWLAGRSAPEPE
ncbi:hypothetical protein GCM10009864_82460 [Streptomyces lunalinharesii]|uniref:Uncharacterized protein n=2 Tax=Streptomyces lunalinharesii TaxID=333384 RepID=A0ABN3T7J7_9ACTN